MKTMPTRYGVIAQSSIRFKNPGEVDRLRTVYGDLFWLLGVFAPEEVRIARLKAAAPNNAYIQLISDQDYDEGTEYGQSDKDTMSIADMFIRNDAQNTVQLQTVLGSFLDRIFEVGVSTPNTDETAMFCSQCRDAVSVPLSTGRRGYSEIRMKNWSDKAPTMSPSLVGGFIHPICLQPKITGATTGSTRSATTMRRRTRSSTRFAKFAEESFKETSEVPTLRNS